MRRSTTVRLLLTLLLPVFLSVSACDFGGSSEDDEETVNHEFSLTITPSSSSSGAAAPKISERDLSGFSFFVDTDDIEEVDEDAFAIYLSENESLSDDNATDGLFGIVARESAQPGTGTYTITNESNGDPSPSEFVGVLYEEMSSSTQSAPIYALEQGTLEITTSTDDKVSGTIDAAGTAYEVTNTSITEEPVDISGSFTAKNLDTYLPFNQYTSVPSQ